VLLDGAPDASVLPINTSDISALSGQAIRVIGYGRNGPSGTSGIKQQVALTAYNIQANQFELGDGVSKGTCLGGSGGPSLHTFPDGVERIVGVHSHGNANCLDGFDARPDAYQGWIAGWLAQYDPLSVGVADGQPCTVGGTPCVSGSTCTGPPGGATFCLLPCAKPGDCPTGWACSAGTPSAYCMATVAPDASTPGPRVQGKGCGASGFDAPAVFFCAALGRLLRLRRLNRSDRGAARSMPAA
jgi:hypothetical protein